MNLNNKTRGGKKIVTRQTSREKVKIDLTRGDRDDLGHDIRVIRNKVKGESDASAESANKALSLFRFHIRRIRCHFSFRRSLPCSRC